jgi:hypothetical protein
MSQGVCMGTGAALDCWLLWSYIGHVRQRHQTEALRVYKGVIRYKAIKICVVIIDK